MRPSLFVFLLPCLLTGCAFQTPVATSAIQGIVHGGQQPIANAHVYLFTANTTGYGGSGIAASSSNASIPLLNSTTTGHSDSIGAATPVSTPLCAGLPATPPPTAPATSASARSSAKIIP